MKAGQRVVSGEAAPTDCGKRFALESNSGGHNDTLSRGNGWLRGKTSARGWRSSGNSGFRRRVGSGKIAIGRKSDA